MIAFCCGVFAVSRLAVLPAISAWWLLLPALVCFAALLRAGWRLALIGSAGLGLCWALLVALQQMQEVLPGYLEGRDFWVRGEVSGLPQRNDRALQFVFELERSCFALLL